MELLRFTASWCGPCKMLAPILDDVAAERDLYVNVIDIDENPAKAGEYGVLGVPTVVLVDDSGMEITRSVGALPKTKLVAALGL